MRQKAESRGRQHGLPVRQGMYDLRTASHGIVQKGLQALQNLCHRGTAGCDPCTGDGAGILIQMPDALFRETVAGFDLPAGGAYGVGMVFLPQDAADRTLCVAHFEKIVADEGQRFLGWRDVPSTFGMPPCP